MSPQELRGYLFLQGPASLFFSRLGAALRGYGFRVFRINFNGGDKAFWRGPGASDYLGGAEGWPGFFRAYVLENKITDLVLLGDCRPLHRAAIAVARELRIKTHIFESGYIRPNWLTLETQGVNGYSTLPKSLDTILAKAAALPPLPKAVRVREPLSRRSVDDVIYSLSTSLLAWRFRRYKRHWPYGQFTEYAHGAHRMFQRLRGGKRQMRELDALLNDASPYYLMPLQIEVDSQIVFHSPYAGQAEVLGLVIESFARFAPGDSRLVITEHPLETSPTDWRGIVSNLAAARGVAERVVFLQGGTSNELVRACRGMVVVNSTTAQDALVEGKPVIALAPAVFNLPGLTFQDGIDAFWTEAKAPDPAIVEAFQRVVISETQINGGFFSAEGHRLAVGNVLRRLGYDKIPAAQKAAAPGEAGLANKLL